MLFDQHSASLVRRGRRCLFRSDLAVHIGRQQVGDAVCNRVGVIAFFAGK
jgi:hypothetical protein